MVPQDRQGQLSVADSISSESLRNALSDRCEIALLDVREKSEFVTGHLWLAVNIPGSQIEERIRRFVPRRSTRIVLCDADGSLASRVAQTLIGIGYTNVRWLDFGVAGWADHGLPLIHGDYVISHSFGFSIESAYKIPVISATELKSSLQSGNNIVVIDTRDPNDYQRNSVPGSINIPVAEVVRYLPDLVRSDDTQIVVHCAGVTRAALGAQTLINAGIPNPVFSLRDGTRGWFVAGGSLISEQTTLPLKPGECSERIAQKTISSLARRHSLNYMTPGDLTQWQKLNPDRTCYVVDVRSREEYVDGHFPGALHIPGGELAGMTIDHLGTYHARLCLIDNGDCARAEITAGWMLQIGWRDIVILKNWQDSAELESGEETEYIPRPFDPEPQFQTHDEVLDHHRQSIALRHSIYERFLQDRPWEFSIFGE